MPDPAPRRGLDAVPPRRVPSLPGRSAGLGVAAGAPDAQTSGSSPARITEPSAARATTATATDRVFRSREFQLAKAESDFVDTTALAIRLASDTTAFDRSALVRGILRAVRECNLDLAARCTSEEDVAACVRDLLLRGTR